VQLLPRRTWIGDETRQLAYQCIVREELDHCWPQHLDGRHYEAAFTAPRKCNRTSYHLFIQLASHGAASQVHLPNRAQEALVMAREFF
jgi:hypothetical protein